MAKVFWLLQYYPAEPLIDAELGLGNQRILAACYKSAKSGTVIEVR
jgi:hypothetical protein